MKVKTATFLFAVLIFILFVLLGFSLVKLTSLQDKEANKLVRVGERIRMATELKSDLLIHNRNVFLYYLHQDASRLEDSEFLRIEIPDLLASLEGRAMNKAELSVLNGLQKEIASYLERQDQLVASRLSSVQHYTEASRNLDGILSIIDDLSELYQSRMDVLIGNIDRQNRMADRISLSVLAVGSAVLLGLIGMMFFYIAHPLRVVAETISRYGSGDTLARVDPRSLSEIRQIGSNFNSMADRLEEKRKERLRFIAAIAHDLRNPLNSMSIASELLERKGGQEYRDLVSIVSRQVKNLDRMVGDLLDTTRIEAGHVDLECSSQNISALIRDSIQLHRASADLHRFNMDFPEEPLLCQCDGGRISQVMNNLLANAIKYSPNGGDVTVRARRAGGGIVVSVADQGIGIAPQDLDDIFKPFHRTQLTRSTIPGIGLGLSASRRIVEAHGGRLWVESEPGCGSIFYFSLPETASRNSSPAVRDQSPQCQTLR